MYDCGTSDSNANLDQELDRLTRELAGYPTIDVLILSHFDHDHVAGVGRLIQRFRVRRLFIPYIPLTERVLIALQQPVVSFDFLQSLMNPARYFFEVAGGNLDEVIFVVGGDHSEPPEPYGAPDAPTPDFPLNQWIRFPRGGPLTPPDGEDVQQGPKAVGTISHVSDRETLAIGGLWEFVFFNKKFKAATPDFVQSVRSLVQQWQWGGRIREDTEIFVESLKNIYEQQFTTSYSRNNISLITYAGPVYDTGIPHTPQLSCNILP